MNVFRQFYRKFTHNKLSFLINILSLVPGLLCSLLIFSWVQFQINFDGFHSNIDRITAVRTYWNVDGEQRYSFGAPYAVGPALKRDFPEVQQFARFSRYWQEITAGDQKFQFLLSPADPGIFQILDINLAEGTAFKEGEKNKCVISERCAKVLFGEKSAIGGFVTIMKEEFVVSGVLKEDWPRNSSIQPFSVLIPWDQKRLNIQNEWGGSVQTLVLLNKAGDLPLFQEKIRDHYKELQAEESYLDTYKLKDFHMVIEGNQSRVYLLSFLALFLLIVACINFINLATASFTAASLQTCIHKIMGITRLKLMYKYMANVFLLVLSAFTLAAILAVVCLPFFASLIGQTIRLDDYYNWQAVGLCVGIIGFTTLLSGLYPAVFLSSFQPIRVLKSKNLSGTKSNMFRNTLVSVQFIISIVLIISILTVSRQLDMYNNLNLGYEREELIYVDLRGTSQGTAFVLKQELLKEPSVVAASACQDLPVDIGYNTRYEKEGQALRAYFTHTDNDWLKVMGIKMQEGSFFTDETPGVVINDEAKKIMGWNLSTDENFARSDSGYLKITGVMDKFLFNNFKEKQPLLIIYPLKGNVFNLEPSYLLVRASGRTLTAMYDLVRHKVKEVDRGGTVGFLDDLTQQFLLEEQQMMKIISIFSGLAVVISCLGLLGMAIYITERKRKEIGIRRVNGAKVSEIVLLLNANLIRPVAIAFLVACPLAYYIMSRWLEHYLHRVNIGWEIFALAGFITICIVILTLTWRSWKAANENPVNCLRDE